MTSAPFGVSARIRFWSAGVLFVVLSAFFADCVLAYAALQRKYPEDVDIALAGTPMTWPPFWGRTIWVRNPIVPIALVTGVVLLVMLLKNGFRALANRRGSSSSLRNAKTL